MPPIQIVFLYRWKQYLDLRDDYFKWGLLPDAEARIAMKPGQSRVDARIKQGDGVPFADALPAIRASFNARLRAQREINLLRAIEALRMYAAEHDRWPDRLEEVTIVPVPNDPYTGKPFDYSPGPTIAMLSTSADSSKNNFTGAARIELVLRKKAQAEGEHKKSETTQP
jgi:hypothetical protein